MSPFHLPMRARGPSLAPSTPDQAQGHPHRCRQGHRWQHAGPTALTCEIPPLDPESGNLPYVSPRECPLCSGREELLVRDVHPHYCPLCEGDWTHDGRCMDGLVSSCPWCF